MKTMSTGMFLGLIIVSSRMFAEDSTNDPLVDFSLDLKSYYKSEYVSPFGRLVYDGPVIQSEVTVWAKFRDIPGKLYFDVWNSYGLKKWNTNSGDESDYSLGWKGEIFEGINLNLWATYFDFLPVGKMTDGGDQIRFFAEFDHTSKHRLGSIFGEPKSIVTLTESICFEAPYTLQGDKGFAGLRTYLGIKAGWEFLPNWSLSSRVNLCLDDGACGFQSGTLLDYRIGLSYQATKWLNIEPLNVRMIMPLSTMSDGRERQTIWSSGLNLKF
jgi:hypothetical protein